MLTKILEVVVAGLIIVAFSFTTYTLYGKLKDSREEVKMVQLRLDALQELKNKSDKAVADLQISLNKNQESTSKQIVRIVQSPVTSDEKCMSNVLRQSLAENTTTHEDGEE